MIWTGENLDEFELEANTATSNERSEVGVGCVCKRSVAAEKIHELKIGEQIRVENPKNPKLSKHHI